MIAILIMDKQHILDEIRRTAEANGGAPLGKKRFFDETGIREADWSGKICSRWGDAVKEAGYEPLKLQGRKDRMIGLRKIAELTRLIGRFPTIAEMRLQRRRDPSFPAHHISGTTGGRSGLVAEVRGYCRSTTDLLDVLEILEKTESAPRTLQTEGAAETSAKRQGYVYLLRAGKNYKIGCSVAPLSRAMAISNMTPEGADRLHEIRTDDPRGIEDYWHRRFADKRGNGEWFSLSPAEVAAFKRRKFM
jgi:hypothetical protein